MVQGEEDQMCHDADVDKNPNEGARRRRKLLQTVTQDPVQQEVPKQKKVKKKFFSLEKYSKEALNYRRTAVIRIIGPLW